MRWTTLPAPTINRRVDNGKALSTAESGWDLYHPGANRRPGLLHRWACSITIASSPLPVIAMYINPTLLLLLALIFVFAPTIQDWVLNGGTAWYRPYVVWILLVVFTWWSQRGRTQE